MKKALATLILSMSLLQVCTANDHIQYKEVDDINIIDIEPMPENIGYDKWFVYDSREEKIKKQEQEMLDKQKRFIGEFELTFYTKAYDEGGSKDAFGNDLQTWYSIAVDPNIIPLGSIVEIEGYGTFKAVDTGGAIKGNILDVCVNTKEEAKRLGRIKNIKVYYAKE